jgi:hypothetical protein
MIKKNKLNNWPSFDAAEIKSIEKYFLAER